MEHYVGFTSADAANIQRIAPHLRPHLSGVVDRFYEVLLTDPAARKVFTGGPEQIRAQHAKLLAWLEEFIGGEYGPAYFQRHSRVGRIHVDVMLPQHYMITGMEVIRHELLTIVEKTRNENRSEIVASINRLLALELAVMLEAYKEFYTADIRSSEREAVAERLIRAEHMAQLGQLAASLAHAIKNPLAGVSGAIQVIRSSLKPDNPHRPIIDEMLAQIDRLDSTVKDLLVYARPKALNLNTMNLNELIARVLNLLREEPTLRPLRVTFSRDDKAPPISGDERQLEQVVMNLLLNAADASSEGDRIAIRTTWDKCIRLEIVDQGVGMSPDELERAFEPFFTTKTKGTGLGLAICRQIVEAHGGVMHIDSKKHHGTTAIVELPADKRGGTPARTAPES